VYVFSVPLFSVLISWIKRVHLYLWILSMLWVCTHVCAFAFTHSLSLPLSLLFSCWEWMVAFVRLSVDISCR
jgi:hypothetical protein